MLFFPVDTTDTPAADTENGTFSSSSRFDCLSDDIKEISHQMILRSSSLQVQDHPSLFLCRVWF